MMRWYAVIVILGEKHHEYCDEIRKATRKELKKRHRERERVKKKWILCDCGVGYGVAIPIANASWMLFVNWQRVSIY